MSLRSWWRRRKERKLDALFAMAYMQTGNQRFWDGISTIPPRPDGKSWGDDEPQTQTPEVEKK